jgi:hypothetical protein
VIKEFQDKQFVPGYYTGKKLHPLLTHTGKPKLLGWFMVFAAGLFLFIDIFLIRDWADLIVMLPIMIIVILAGIGLIRRKRV